MKKYELKIILIQAPRREVLIHESKHFFKWLAVVAAWWHGRHFQCLVRERLFKVNMVINKI